MSGSRKLAVLRQSAVDVYRELLDAGTRVHRRVTHPKPLVRDVRDAPKHLLLLQLGLVLRDSWILHLIAMVEGELEPVVHPSLAAMCIVPYSFH